MVKDRVRVKEPNPLQNPRVSPRFRMTQSGQRRQRPKIFLPLNWTRKKSLFLQSKSEVGAGRIRFLVRQNLDFHPAPCVTRVRVWISHRRYHPYLLDCCQSNTCSIATRASMEIWRSCFFFSSTTDATHTCLIVAGARLRIYRSRVPLFFYSQLLIQACLSLFMYIVLFIYLIKR